MSRAEHRLLGQVRLRLRHAGHELGNAVLGSITPAAHRWTWLRHVPPWPFRAGPPAPWPTYSRATPPALRTVPGIWRNADAAQRAFDEHPVYDFFTLHPEAAPLLPRYGWAWQLPSLPRRLRTRLRPVELVARQPAPPAPDLDPATLTEEIRAQAKALGLSQVGFAPFDPKYVYGRRADGRDSPAVDEGTVIVCLLEQDWKLTQAIPSARSERGVMRTYSDLVDRACALAEFLHRKGIRAQVGGPGGPLVSIHFAVEAGLGQLGLNGQLLTPRAGSRCRITVITTNAKLVHGEPADFGIHAICDQCRLCVKRCPPGAIPVARREHRGVTKARIKPDRCLPTMAQAHGCAICMKVCPVQRYGLEAVTEHLHETGEILGKGTDELEGYDWLDGRHYGPGQKPRITKQFVTPRGVAIDPKRTVPPLQASSRHDDHEDLTIS